MRAIAQQISDLSAQLASQSAQLIALLKLSMVTPAMFMGVSVVICFGLGWIAGRLR
ncbi:hypothetical protein [Undibacterium sp.]|uniref:hypothetical protein n=1 Tax=Undibacterium sp. TaxID=1914977 RepID=UPI003753406D